MTLCKEVGEEGSTISQGLTKSPVSLTHIHTETHDLMQASCRAYLRLMTISIGKNGETTDIELHDRT